MREGPHFNLKLSSGPHFGLNVVLDLIEDLFYIILPIKLSLDLFMSQPPTYLPGGYKAGGLISPGQICRSRDLNLLQPTIFPGESLRLSPGNIVGWSRLMCASLSFPGGIGRLWRPIPPGNDSDPRSYSPGIRGGDLRSPPLIPGE